MFVISGMPHSTVAIRQGERVWSPYGVAKLDLSGLLQGQRLLELTVPVTGGPRCLSDLQHSDGGTVSCRDYTVPLSPGDYIGSHCELKVIVEVIHPLCPTYTPAKLVPSLKTSPLKQRELVRTPSKAPSTPNRRKLMRGVLTNQLTKLDESPPRSKNTCPFNRLIYVVSSEGVVLVQRLIAEVNHVNSKALGLEELSEEILCAALSTYKLTKDQMTSSECDVITGFHVEDWEQHVVVLEGLKTGGLKRIWDDLPHHFTEGRTIYCYSSTAFIYFNAYRQFHTKLELSL